MNDVKIDVAARVAEVVGKAALAPAADLPKYAVDGVTPSVVAMPESSEQVARVLAFAGEAGLAVIPWGGGTAMGAGGVPKAVDIVLSTQRLAKVIDYSPEDMTVTAQAGVTLAELQILLTTHGQMLPLDPPEPKRATVGGILAANASGPLRYQFGMPRDLVLGTVVAYADGTVAKAGGRTVKNVAGYDMSRLHIGALGTLGVIVEATFKVTPLPKVMVTVGGAFPTLASAVAAARALRMARIVPWSIVLAAPGALPGQADGYTVAVRLGGQPAVVTPQMQRRLETLQQQQGSGVAEIANAEDTFWPAVRDWPAAGGEGVMVRLGLTPSHVQSVLEAAQGIAESNGVQATFLSFPGAATIFCALAGTPEQAAGAVTSLAALAKEHNGNLAIERAPRLVKERTSAWGLATADALAQRVKSTYDPKGVLNPGRFVGGL